jgi:hypothetical protein
VSENEDNLHGLYDMTNNEDRSRDLNAFVAVARPGASVMVCTQLAPAHRD